MNVRVADKNALLKNLQSVITLTRMKVDLLCTLKQDTAKKKEQPVKMIIFS